jgi:hypothetical protein
MTRTIIFFLIISLNIRCVDPIDLVDSDQAISMLVINGKISKTNKKGYVAVDLIQSTFNTDRSFGVTASEVAVINEKGEKLVLEKLQIGRYEASETAAFPFVYGKLYKISVVNGKDIYESNFMELNTSPLIQNSALNFTPKIDENKGTTGKLAISINTVFKESDKNKFLKWELLRSYQLTEQEFSGPLGRKCYVLNNKDDKLNEKLLDGRDFNVNKPFDFVVTDRSVDNLFAEGTYYTIIQEAVDFSTFKYFQAYNNLVQREGNIFETPPGPMPTNFRCVSDSTKLVNGYFYATQQDTSRIFIDPSKVGNPKRLCPVPPVEFNACPVVQCCDCLKLKNGTIRKPFYWN